MRSLLVAVGLAVSLASGKAAAGEPPFTIGSRPVWVLLGGVATGGTVALADRGAFVGGELSLARLRGGNFFGFYADGYYDWGANGTYATSGIELGHKLVGLDAGAALRFADGATNGGVTGRLTVGLGVVGIFGRYIYTGAMQQAMRTTDDEGVSVVDRGDAGDALEGAEVKVSGLYEAPYLAHAPLEPQSATVSVTGERAEVWVSAQSPTVVQAFVSDAIGIDFEAVTVHILLTGGGFGRRIINEACAEAAIISKRMKRPVKVIWTRESDMTQAYYRPLYAVKTEGAIKAGKVTGARIHCTSQSITLSSRMAFSIAMTSLPRSVTDMLLDAMLAIFSTNSYAASSSVCPLPSTKRSRWSTASSSSATSIRSPSCACTRRRRSLYRSCRATTTRPASASPVCHRLHQRSPTRSMR